MPRLLRITIPCRSGALRVELSSGLYIDSGLHGEFVARPAGQHSHLLLLHPPDVRRRIPVRQIARLQLELHILLGSGLDASPA